MRYLVEPNGAPAMAEAEALALWRRACDLGDAAGRERLAENFQPMVAAEARRFAVRGGAAVVPSAAASAAAERRAGWGNLGLLRALCCYREGASIGFYDFCRRRIRETMQAEARSGGSAAARGIDGAAEVARLWGELSREFSDPAPERLRERPPRPLPAEMEG